MSEYVTCTPHRPNCRFFMFFEDFLDLNDHDVICASALRVIETMTNSRITYLRSRYHISSKILPNEDDLWIEPSLRDLEWWSVEIRRKSAYARALLPCHEKHPTLIERGFVRSRLIARRDDLRLQIGEDGKPKKPSRPARKVRRDDQGSYLVVDDAAGGYEENGRWYAAADSGYTKIVRQFLYCIEVVRAAIAGLDGDPPPKPHERFRSIATGEKYREESEQPRETTISVDNSLPSSTNAALLSDARRGTSPTSGNTSFAYHDNTISGEVSIKIPSQSSNSQEIRALHERTEVSENGQGRPQVDTGVRSRNDASSNGDNKNQKESKNLQRNTKKDSAHASRFSLLSSILTDSDHTDLRSAPWCPETILALVSRVMPVPNYQDIEESGDTAAIEEFYEDWLRPTERLMQRLDSSPPADAWHDIDYASRFMTQPGSPSWFRAHEPGQPRHEKHRSRNDPVTMAVLERNFLAQLSELQRRQWHPSNSTPYDGPPQSWLGNAGSPSPGADADVGQQRGMVRILADRLAGRIMADHPGIIVSNVERGAGRFAIGVALGQDDWLDFESEESYFDADEEMAALIEQAAAYGRGQHGAMRA